MTQTPVPLILSFLTFLPLVGALILMVLPSPADQPSDGGKEVDDPNRAFVNWVALGFSLMTLFLAITLFVSFQAHYFNPFTRSGMQFVDDFKWMAFGKIDIHYRMGVDGFSLLLIMLTTVLVPLCIYASFNVKKRLKEYMIFLLLLESGILGVFTSLDLVLFYFFWEATLIPMYFLIGVFGQANRAKAAVKFFVYTFIGSVLMLVAIIGVYNTTGTFDLTALADHSGGPGQLLVNANPKALLWMFAAFSLAFMIKVPMFPFHTWQPDAYCEAPTAATVLLSGLMAKMGTYGFIRFCLPLFPVQARENSMLFIALAVIAIVYASMIAITQPDSKRLIAYSSIAHLGIVMLGIFSFTRVGLTGAMIQCINHGITTPMLFFIVGMLQERKRSTLISDFGGLKKSAPMMATFLLIATLASIAVPFFNGFVGEFPILLGSWVSQLSGPIPTAIAASGMVLSAIYMLWWFQRIMLGPISHVGDERMRDLSKREMAVLIPLAGLIFWIGLGSVFFTDRLTYSTEAILGYGKEMVTDTVPVYRQQTLLSNIIDPTPLRKDLPMQETTPQGENHRLGIEDEPPVREDGQRRQ